MSICFTVSTSNNEKKSALRGFADKKPTVFTFQKESEMLSAFRDFINIFDPDIITGYNTSKFDIPFTCERNKAIGMETSNEFSRILGNRKELFPTDY